MVSPSLAWIGICALALKDNVGLIADIPGGIYIRKVGDWRVAFNGRREENTYLNHAIGPMTAYVEFNGWPAGLIGASGGALAAGALANENTFIAAIEADLGCGIEDYLARADA